MHKHNQCAGHFPSNQLADLVRRRLQAACEFFCPGRETGTGGNTLTGSPGVLTRVRAAEGKEWLWEAVAPLSSLSTDYEAGPRRVPSGTPQATHSLPLLCYRICRWGIRLKCEEGCMREDVPRILNMYVQRSFVVIVMYKKKRLGRQEGSFVPVIGLMKKQCSLSA